MKWALGGVTLIAVIAITAAVSIALTKGSGGGGDGTPSASASPSASAPGTVSNTSGEIASANDTGPANIIKEDPTCAAWTSINNALAKAEKNGWDKRDPQIPASEWAPDVRAQYEEVGRAMKTASDQTASLLKVTPHRVMRQLYEQFMAYAQAYNNAIPNYQPIDNYLAAVVGDSSTALVRICAAISYGSAASRSPQVTTEPKPPTTIAQPLSGTDPQRFMAEPNSTCSDWDRILHQFQNDVAGWQELDPKKAAADWNADQRATVDAVIPVMKQFADQIESLGRSSGNPTLEDFAVTAAQYRRSFAEALPTYGTADSYLSALSVNMTAIIYDACKAAGA